MDILHIMIIILAAIGIAAGLCLMALVAVFYWAATEIAVDLGKAIAKMIENRTGTDILS